MFKKLQLLILFILFCSVPALADTDYTIEKYSLLIDIQADGSAHITEHLLYDFDSDYNGILSLFDTDGIDGIDDFRVTIDDVEMTPVEEMTYIENTYTITELDDSLFEVRVYSPGRNDNRTVIYEYTMQGLAHRYADTGMIHRKLIGMNNSVTLRQADIVINFPGNADTNHVEAFVHGGMDASHISSSENLLFIGPEDVHSGEAVEVRLLFPASWLSDADIINQSMYDSAIAEEAQLAEDERLRAIRIENAKYLFTAAYLIIFFTAWFMLAKKYGLKGRLHETPDPRRVSSYPAAFLTAAVEEEADTDALTGTLMELVADGSIGMEAEGDDLRFTRINQDLTGYYPHQAVLTDWLFDQRSSFLLSELNAGTDYERAQQFETGYNRYINQVSGDMLASKLRFKNDALRITVNALIIILGAMGTGGVLLAGKPNLPLGILLGGSLFLLIALMSRVRRLTDEGERLAMDAEAFKNAGITTDSGLSSNFAYYAALGMTEPLIKAIEACVSDFSHSDTPVWMYTGWYYSLHQLNASMRDTHHHNASIPNPNSTSSSGRSSGGGGGGHGAW